MHILKQEIYSSFILLQNWVCNIIYSVYRVQSYIGVLLCCLDINDSEYVWAAQIKLPNMADEISSDPATFPKVTHWHLRNAAVILK